MIKYGSQFNSCEKVICFNKFNKIVKLFKSKSIPYNGNVEPIIKEIAKEMNIPTKVIRHTLADTGKIIQG